MSTPNPKKRRPLPLLITHREVAKLVGVTPQCLRNWCGRGSWPKPHAIVERTWLYKRADVEFFLARGLWPDTVEFCVDVHAGLPRPFDPRSYKIE